MQAAQLQWLDATPENLVIIDPIADRFRYVSKRAALSLNISQVEQEQRFVSQYFYPSLAKLISFSQAVMENGEGFVDELILFNDLDEERVLEVAASCICTPKEVLLCFSLRDKELLNKWRMTTGANRYHQFGLLHWQRIHEVFEHIEKENQLILSAAGEGIYGVDVNGNATFINPAAERILGWKAEDLIGKNIHALIHHSHANGSEYCVHDCPIYAAFRDGTIRQVDDEVFWTREDKAVPVAYTSTPILDNGHLVGAVVVFRDISDRLEAETKLRSALAEVESLKHKLEMENAYLLEEISEEFNFHHIIGRSSAVQQIVHQIQLVAPTVATVLITGESGTGKELIARAIHAASERRERPLIRVNCAAIPRDLFESEFFGHVRGAFSGALADRLGRFEVADGGTLFLDEVGEIPLELQGKLLRVLQDSEFERVGDSSTRQVDVRVIAATNRDLLQLVERAQFRQDLYFRLNVFPIHSVALRYRREDIPQLAKHFLAKVCKRFHKNELKISLGHIQQLKQYSWPGNIRELENLIERQVILSQGDKLEMQGQPFNKESDEVSSTDSLSEIVTERDCQSYQRQAIINALCQSRGKLYGENGAARLLGIKPTTLASRIKKYGIQKSMIVERLASLEML